jgi:hypothetical protein
MIFRPPLYSIVPTSLAPVLEHRTIRERLGYRARLEVRTRLRRVLYLLFQGTPEIPWQIIRRITEHGSMASAPISPLYEAASFKFLRSSRPPPKCLSTGVFVGQTLERLFLSGGSPGKRGVLVSSVWQYKV